MNEHQPESGYAARIKGALTLRNVVTVVAVVVAIVEAFLLWRAYA